MNYKADITVMPLPELLDPEGKAVTSGLRNLGLTSIDNVRVGKYIQLEVEAGSKEQAEKEVETACQKLLANPVIEGYQYTLQEKESKTKNDT